MTTISATAIRRWDLGVPVRPDMKAQATAWLLPLLALTPAVAVSRGIPSVRAEEAVLAGVLLTALTRGRVGVARTSGVQSLVVLGFGLLAVLTLVSMLWAAVALDVVPSVRDLFEILKYIKYTLLFILGLSTARRWRRDDQIGALLAGTVALSSVIALLQYFNIFNINGWLSPLYTESQLDRLQVGSPFERRVIGTFANPNVFGLFCAFVQPFLGFSLLSRGHVSARVLLALTLSLIALPMTGSREAMAVSVIGNGATLAMSLVKFRPRGKNLLLFGGMGVLGGVTLWYLLRHSEYLRYRLLQIQDLTTFGSLRSRVDIKWPLIWQAVKESPLIGHGPAKTELDWAVDSEYLLVMYRYGLAGAAVYYGMLLSLGLVLARRLVGRAKNPYSTPWRAGALVLLGLALITNVFSTTLYDLQLGSFLWLMLGFAFGMPDGKGCRNAG